jgi:HK97 family phage portal protein
MGFLDRLGMRGYQRAIELSESAPGPRFEVVIDPVMLYGSSLPSSYPISPRVSRREAMTVPAVKRGRDLIAGSLGGLPLNLMGPDFKVTDWSLFDQPEKDVPRSVTLTRTFEDLLFEQVAWWKVTAVGWHGRPVEVVRLDPTSVTVAQDMKVYVTRQGHQGTVQQWVPDEHLIRFDGPNDPLLVAGARAIRACLALDAAALRHADGAPPLDFFTPADGADLGEDADVQGMLDAWRLARQTRSTGYVPGALKYNVAGWDPEKLQLAEARQHAVLEIARLMGVDPEELGVSTTSRTYNNAFDRRKAFVDFTLGAYRQAFEDRLSMNDVSPRGYKARLDLSDFLRSDDKTRMEVYEKGLAVGAITHEEIRVNEKKPELTADQLPQQPVPSDSEDMGLPNPQEATNG